MMQAQRPQWLCRSCHRWWLGRSHGTALPHTQVALYMDHTSKLSSQSLHISILICALLAVQTSLERRSEPACNRSGATLENQKWCSTSQCSSGLGLTWVDRTWSHLTLLIHVMLTYHTICGKSSYPAWGALIGPHITIAPLQDVMLRIENKELCLEILLSLRHVSSPIPCHHATSLTILCACLFQFLSDSRFLHCTHPFFTKIKSHNLKTWFLLFEWQHLLPGHRRLS